MSLEFQNCKKYKLFEFVSSKIEFSEQNVSIMYRMLFRIGVPNFIGIHQILMILETKIDILGSKGDRSLLTGIVAF